MNKPAHKRDYLESDMRATAAELKSIVEESGLRLLSHDGLTDNTVWYKGYLITEAERDQLQNNE